MLNSIEDDVLVVKFMTMQIPLHIHENGISLFFFSSRLYPVGKSLCMGFNTLCGVYIYVYALFILFLNFDEAMELCRSSFLSEVIIKTHFPANSLAFPVCVFSFIVYKLSLMRYSPAAGDSFVTTPQRIFH